MLPDETTTTLVSVTTPVSVSAVERPVFNTRPIFAICEELVRYAWPTIVPVVLAGIVTDRFTAAIARYVPAPGVTLKTVCIDPVSDVSEVKSYATAVTVDSPDVVPVKVVLFNVAPETVPPEIVPLLVVVPLSVVPLSVALAIVPLLRVDPVAVIVPVSV